LSADAPWDNVTLVWHSIGWHFGLALIVPVNDSSKTVWLKSHVQVEERSHQVRHDQISAWRISEEAKRKLSKMGLVAA
jgi:hypothetical protein